jgi:hypothetical protein
MENAMAETEVEFSKYGGKLEIVLEVGQNKTGVSSFFVFDKDGNRLQRQETTSTLAAFQINTDPSELDEALLMLNTTINGAKEPAQKWSFTVTIRQDGKVMGSFEYPETDGEDPETFKMILVMKTKEVRLRAK